MSLNLNSLKGAIQGIIYGTTKGVVQGDTRSLDHSSYENASLLGMSCGDCHE